MFKFKVGDSVKVISKNMSASGRAYNGKVGIIMKQAGKNRFGNFYRLDIDYRHGGIYEQELELVGKIIKTFGIVKFLEEIKC